MQKEVIIKNHTEVKTRIPSSNHATLVPNVLAHQAQMYSALFQANVQSRLEISAVNPFGMQNGCHFRVHPADA